MAEQGVWDAIVVSLIELGFTDDWQQMIHSTIMHDPSQAAGAKGRQAEIWTIARRLELRQIHAVCDSISHPIALSLKGGEASDYKGAEKLLALDLPKPRIFFADPVMIATGYGNRCS